jgi:hypothetical protein
MIDWVVEIGLSYLCNVFTDLLGRETKRPYLGGKGSGGADFTASCSEVEDLDLVGIEFWRHCWDYEMRLCARTLNDNALNVAKRSRGCLQRNEVRGNGCARTELANSVYCPNV